MIRLVSNTAEAAPSSWETVPLGAFAAAVVEGAQQSRAVTHGCVAKRGPLVVAVNGRSGAGKSTLARTLAEALDEAGHRVALLAADDLMWWEPMWEWAPLAIGGVLGPLQQGESVHFTPPQWRARGRPGAIRIAADTEVVLFEGVGSSQQAFTDYLDASIWVQSDHVTARQEGVARDIASGVNGDPVEAAAFWDDWDASESAFLEQDQPWDRAGWTVLGNNVDAWPPGAVRVARPALVQWRSAQA